MDYSVTVTYSEHIFKSKYKTPKPPINQLQISYKQIRNSMS